MTEILTQKDIESETWQKIKAHLTERKQNLLERLAGDMPESEAMKLRGRIAECKDLMRLEERKEEEEVHTEF